MTTHRFTDRMTMDGALKRTDEGWAAQARVAKGGNVQTYLGSEMGLTDRATVRVYRPEDEVFARDAISTYARKPITIGHPEGGVDGDNWKDLAVGEIDRDVMRDGEFVSVPLLFRDAKAVALLSDGGPRELSMGYDAAVEFRDGETPSGEAYDAVMTGFRMNHVAVVPRARGGSELRIGDGADNWGAAPITTADGKGDTMPQELRTIMVDGLSVQTTDAGAQAIEKLNGTIAAKDKAAADAKAEHEKAIAAKDAEIAKLEAAKDAAEAKVMSDADLDKRVQARADLVTVAKKIHGDVKTEGVADAEIRKAVVKAKLGDAAVEGRSDAYVDARFEILAEEAGKTTDPVNDAMKRGSVSADDVDKLVADTHAKMLADLKTGRVTEKEEA